MGKSELIKLPYPILVNGLLIENIIIGDHYREKHLDSINDRLIVSLVLSLSGGFFDADSSTRGIDYFATDIELSSFFGKPKIYRLVWLIEGECLDIIGVINAYRTNSRRK